MLNLVWLVGRKMLKTGLNEETYRERFQLLLHLEEIQMEVDIRQFDMDNTCMQRCPTNKRLLSLQVVFASTFFKRGKEREEKER